MLSSRFLRAMFSKRADMHQIPRRWQTRVVYKGSCRTGSSWDYLEEENIQQERKSDLERIWIKWAFCMIKITWKRMGVSCVVKIQVAWALGDPPDRLSNGTRETWPHSAPRVPSHEGRVSEYSPATMSCCIKVSLIYAANLPQGRGVNRGRHLQVSPLPFGLEILTIGYIHQIWDDDLCPFVSQISRYKKVRIHLSDKLSKEGLRNSSLLFWRHHPQHWMVSYTRLHPCPLT